MPDETPRKAIYPPTASDGSPVTGQNLLRIRALFGDYFEAHDTIRSQLLVRARRIRAERAWVKEGCYAWLRLTRDLKMVQREMRAMRS